MKKFDPLQPLIFIHIPKSAGTSVRKVFEKWYGSGLITHYKNEIKNEIPKRSTAFDNHTSRRPVCIYGHFNSLAGFGVQDSYPDARQFMTIIREPFEQAVSFYYYTKKVDLTRKNKSPISSLTLSEYIHTKPSLILNYFPVSISYNNYREVIDKYFVSIGITEELERSLYGISNVLGFRLNSKNLPRLNVTARGEEMKDAERLRAIFKERNSLEYEIYNYVKLMFKEQNLGSARSRPFAQLWRKFFQMSC